MYYTKTIDGKRIMLEDLRFFSSCPNCGREVEEPDVMWMATYKGIDPYCTRSYCRRCSKHVIERGRAVRM